MVKSWIKYKCWLSQQNSDMVNVQVSLGNMNPIRPESNTTTESWLGGDSQ